MTQFRARRTGNYSLSGTTELNFNVVDFDTDNGFASNRFTVPASWNGRYCQLFAGLRTTSVVTGIRLGIQERADGGASWSTAADIGDAVSVDALYVTSPVMQFTTGYIYRCVSTGTATVGTTTVANNFSGCIFPVTPANTYGCRLTKSTGQSISNGSFVTTSFNGTRFDTSGFFDDATDNIIIPGGFPASYGVITGGIGLPTYSRFRES